MIKMGCRNLEIKVSGKKYNKSLFLTAKIEYNGCGGYTVKCETMVEIVKSSLSKCFAQSVMVDVKPKSPNTGISFAEFLSECLLEFSAVVTGAANDINCSKLMSALLLENFEMSLDVWSDLMSDTKLIHSIFVERKGDKYIEVAFTEGEELYFEVEPYNVGLKGKGVSNNAEIEFKIL